MRILWVDDERTPDFEAVIARTSEEALSLISDGWDEVWLDHDLGGEDTSRPIVSFLEEQSIIYGIVFEIGKFFVHSKNPVGAKWLADGIDKSGYRVMRVELPSLSK